MKNKIVIIFIIFLTVFASAEKSLLAQQTNFLLYGYAQLDYQTSTEKNFISGFNQRRLNLIGEFSYFNRLRIIGDIEFEGGSDIAVGDSASFGVVKLSRALIEYSISPELKLSAGKMLTNFGLYNLIHDASATYYPVDPPLIYSKHSPVAGQKAQRLFGKYLIGLGASGVFELGDSYGQLEYFLGVGNGRGISSAGDDLNANKAINSRLIFRPAFLTGLQMGLSYYGDINYYGLSGMTNAEENSIAGDIQFENSFIQLQSELLYTEFEVHSGSFRQSLLSYIQAAVTVFDVFTPFINYSTVDYDIKGHDNYFSRINFGLNYSVLPNLFLKGEVQFHSTEEELNAEESFIIFKATVAAAF